MDGRVQEALFGCTIAIRDYLNSLCVANESDGHVETDVLDQLHKKDHALVTKQFIDDETKRLHNRLELCCRLFDKLVHEHVRTNKYAAKETAYMLVFCNLATVVTSLAFESQALFLIPSMDYTRKCIAIEIRTNTGSFKGALLLRME